MSADPNAQFDQTVLELIEHHPQGAVPGTPAYQDALRRLYGTHQVYASADSGDSWMPIVHDLPAVLSVEAQVVS